MQHGTGALPDGWDPRDYHYAPGAGEFDWATGYDVEDEIGVKLDVKDQNGSASCGAQAWAYYGEVLETVATGSYEPRSARWIYSHTWVEGGGSRGRDNCDHVIKKGWLQEKYATSYENGKPPHEDFMRIKPKDVREDTETARALSYLQVTPSMENVAKAVAENHGCIISVSGQDNGTWRTAFPKPPKSPKTIEWGHWLYVGKAKTIKGKKYIGVLNSWGDDTGEKGWQWLGEDYFQNGYVKTCWTLAWDYKPAKTKLLMNKAIKLLQALLTLKTNNV